jgi:hypothetical protein
MVAQNSVLCLAKYTLKYVKHFFITKWTYKNGSKWDPRRSMHNSQHYDTIL